MNPARLLSHANTRTQLESYASRLPKKHYLALRVAWHGDSGERTRHDLYGWLMMAFCDFLDANEIPPPPKGTMTKMCHLVMDELANPLPGEKGENEFIGRPTSRPEKGNARALRAQRIGVTARQYNKRYQKSYEALYTIAIDWVNSGWRHVKSMQKP